MDTIAAMSTFGTCTHVQTAHEVLVLALEENAGSTLATQRTERACLQHMRPQPASYLATCNAQVSAVQRVGHRTDDSVPHDTNGVALHSMHVYYIKIKKVKAGIDVWLAEVHVVPMANRPDTCACCRRITGPGAPFTLPNLGPNFS